MQPTNVVMIMADQHSPRVLGCYGHEQVRTPNLDQFAANGARFASAYTNSPLCVAARAVDDPAEVTNLATDPGQAARLPEMEAMLRAKVDEAAHVESHGGRDAILAAAPIHGPPVPGGESTRVI